MLFVYQGMFQVASGDTPAFINALNSYAIGTPLDSQASALQTDDSLSPSSLDSVVAERSIKTENFGNSSSVNSLNCMDNNQVSSILYWNKPIMLICSYALSWCANPQPGGVMHPPKPRGCVLEGQLGLFDLAGRTRRTPAFRVVRAT